MRGRADSTYAGGRTVAAVAPSERQALALNLALGVGRRRRRERSASQDEHDHQVDEGPHKEDHDDDVKAHGSHP